MPRAAPRSSKDETRKAAPRPPRQMTERRLANIATFYLERYSTTARQLRQVLTRRVDRALKSDGKATRAEMPTGRAQHDRKEKAGSKATRAEMIAWVEALVERLVASGAVNDVAYAEGKAARMRSLGKGPGRIKAALRAKGITAGEAERVLAETATRPDGTSADLTAALAYIRRRRLGPFRKTPRDRDTDRRDLGAVARAGFSLDVARAAFKLAAAENEDSDP